MPHLPMSLAELQDATGENQFDFILVSGDAYVDHQSFGPAIIGRVLEAEGFTVGIIAQPSWKTTKDFLQLGLPRYAFLVSAGNIDSMVNHYTAAKRKRSSDAYTEGGVAGKRPDRANSVYCKMLRQCAPDLPIICGGIEASLRRFAHYDYWSDQVQPSELVGSGADLLIYGMGEAQITEIAHLLRSGVAIADITEVRGTSVRTLTADPDATLLPGFETVALNKKAYANAAVTIYGQQDAVRGKAIYQQYTGQNGLDFFYVKQNPPMPPLSREAFDRVYELPYMGTPHPRYKEKIPAVEEIAFSIVHNRGCFGACNFCALTLHQGRTVTSRSKDSLVREGHRIAARPDFKGYIHDVGGPTANFRGPSCQKQLRSGVCKNKECLGFSPCANVEADHTEYLEVLRALRDIPGVKKVFVRSGLRYDYMQLDKSSEFFRELVQHHISGQLKVAPEHISDNVLRLMGKPPQQVFDNFREMYQKYNREYKKDQYLVPYLMSSHPGSTLRDAIELAVYLKKHRLFPEQVQDFYPTPGTLSTAMYHTGLDPRDGKRVYVAKDQSEKDLQRALLQFFRPQNAYLVRNALQAAGREDLIGYGELCLVRPDTGKGGYTPFTRDKGAKFVRGTEVATEASKPAAAPPQANRGKGQKRAPKDGEPLGTRPSPNAGNGGNAGNGRNERRPIAGSPSGALVKSGHGAPKSGHGAPKSGHGASTKSGHGADKNAAPFRKMEDVGTVHVPNKQDDQRQARPSASAPKKYTPLSTQTKGASSDHRKGTGKGQSTGTGRGVGYPTAKPNNTHKKAPRKGK